MNASARKKGFAVARAVVEHADGTSDVHYSIPKVGWRQRWALYKHMRFMRAEDRKAGYGR